jgi:hypothetical protein
MRGSAVASSFWSRRWRAEWAIRKLRTRRSTSCAASSSGYGRRPTAASAAKACAESGNTDQALALLRDIEPPLYEVTTLLNAASLLRGNHAG